MKILDENTIQELDKLIDMECELLNKGYSISNTVGNTFLSNSITSFVDNFLKIVYGEIIPSYSSEYRYFIVGILKNIDNAYFEEAMQEVLIPTVRRIGSEELLSILNESLWAVFSES